MPADLQNAQEPLFLQRFRHARARGNAPLFSFMRAEDEDEDKENCPHNAQTKKDDLEPLSPLFPINTDNLPPTFDPPFYRLSDVVLSCNPEPDNSSEDEPSNDELRPLFAQDTNFVTLER